MPFAIITCPLNVLLKILLQGNEGDKGVKGEVGPPGNRGPPGNAGDRGMNGTMGMKGENGSKGDSGMIGALGDRGRKGYQGNKGIDVSIRDLINTMCVFVSISLREGMAMGEGLDYQLRL